MADLKIKNSNSWGESGTKAQWIKPILVFLSDFVSESSFSDKTTPSFSTYVKNILYCGYTTIFRYAPASHVSDKILPLSRSFQSSRAQICLVSRLKLLICSSQKSLATRLFFIFYTKFIKKHHSNTRLNQNTTS